MPMTSLWKPADVTKLVSAVSKATSFDDAVARAKKAIPNREFTRHSIDQHLRRLGKDSLATFIQANVNSKKGPNLTGKGRTVADLEEHRLRETVKELEAANADLIKALNVSDKKVANLLQLSALKPARPVVMPKGRGEGKQRRGCPVLLISDTHIEEPVDPAKVNGLNRYDLGIAEQCFEKLADAWEWMLTDPRYDCREGIVWLGGDLFSGHIHDELVEKNFLSPVRAGAWLLDRLEKFFRTILARSPRMERLIVPCNDGNHGRMTHKMRIASRTDNSLEWFLYFNLANRLRDEKRIEFQIAEGEYTFLSIFDQNLCFFHGDSVKYAGGVGGILVPMKRGLNELRKYQPEGKPVHVFNVGHFHQYLNHGDVVVNGSMIGVTPYGMRYKFQPERRCQAWYMIDSTQGKCLSAPIWLPKTGLL